MKYCDLNVEDKIIKIFQNIQVITEVFGLKTLSRKAKEKSQKYSWI